MFQETRLQATNITCLCRTAVHRSPASDTWSLYTPFNARDFKVIKLSRNVNPRALLSEDVPASGSGRPANAIVTLAEINMQNASKCHGHFGVLPQHTKHQHVYFLSTCIPM